MIMDLNSFVEFLIILGLALIGSFSNDYYNILKGTELEVDVFRILVGAFTGALLVYGISDDLANRVNGKLFMSIYFISGVGGFKLFECIRTIQLANVLKRVLGFKSLDDISPKEPELVQIRQEQEDTKENK